MQLQLHSFAEADAFSTPQGFVDEYQVKKDTIYLKY